MANLRGLLGFITGILVGGVIFTLSTMYLPLLIGQDVSSQSGNALKEISEEQAPETVSKPTVEAEKPAEPAETEEPAEIVNIEAPTSSEPAAETVAVPQVDGTQENITPETPATDENAASVVAIQSESSTPEVEATQITDEEPETPKVSLITEEPEAEAEAEEEPNKINLPTIEVENPTEESVESEAPSIEEPEISVGEKPSSALPTITAESESSPEEAPEDAVLNNALELNATVFENKGQPLLGVILEDASANGLDVQKLKKLNAPLTIAINMDDPNASARALEYSAAGFEVIAMVSDKKDETLNSATSFEQVQNAMELVFNEIPNAIGLLDSAQGRLQNNNRISGDIVENLGLSGHGLITSSNGLNSIDRVAQAAGVRSAKITRVIDAKGESKKQIARYLDRVSLDAGRDGAAIILGTTAKDTVATIAVWLLSPKGQSVTLAPASAVLLQE